MNHKIVVIALSALLTVAVVWLFNGGQAAPVPAKVAAAPAPAAPKATGKAVTPQVDAPRIAPATPQASAAPAVASAAASGTAGAQAELNAMLGDIAGLMQSGDYLTLFQRYAPPDMVNNMPPEERAQIEQELSAGPPPEAQPQMQMVIGLIQGMQSQTPTINDAGDLATYMISDPTGRDTTQKPLSFRKIDGKWYVDQKSMDSL